jgi:hypothetical protein
MLDSLERADLCAFDVRETHMVSLARTSGSVESSERSMHEEVRYWAKYAGLDTAMGVLEVLYTCGVHYWVLFTS